MSHTCLQGDESDYEIAGPSDDDMSENNDSEEEEEEEEEALDVPADVLLQDSEDEADDSECGPYCSRCALLADDKAFTLEYQQPCRQGPFAHKTVSIPSECPCTAWHGQWHAHCARMHQPGLRAGKY